MLFILAATMFSCSDDDQQNKTTPFEGTWLLIHLEGDFPSEDVPPQNISLQNIRYIFQGNKYSVTMDGEIDEQGTFEIIENSYGMLQLHLKRDALGYTIVYTVLNFSEDNNTVILQDDSDWILTLERIQ